MTAPTGGFRLTIVVPVYQVSQYLLQCLDSIFAEASAEVEVIAVDDCSPDECPAMLDKYAAAQPRLTVVHLARNVGLGLARNAGLDQANGEYVWFVDSDDWLPPGSIPAVLARLAETSPDVLLLDHLRVYDDGRIERDLSSPLLGHPDLPESAPVVTLAEQPRLLKLQHTAWNRVVRRVFLDEIGLRFFPGWYEDFPFSHPVLIAAERIAVLGRVCYFYRQRGVGAITKTPSARHFEVFDQYERLYELLDLWGPERTGAIRPTLFSRMIGHYLVIIGNEGRIPPELRRDFFARVVEHYYRFRPATGYPLPGGMGSVKHQLVRLRAYPFYAVLRHAYRLVNSRARERAAPRHAQTPASPGALMGDTPAR